MGNTISANAHKAYLNSLKSTKDISTGLPHEKKEHESAVKNIALGVLKHIPGVGQLAGAARMYGSDVSLVKGIEQLTGKDLSGLKKAAAVAEFVPSKLKAGAMGAVEGMTDFVAGIGAQAVGQKDAAKWIYNHSWSQDFSGSRDVDEQLDNGTSGYRVASDLISGIGNVGLQVGIGLATGGAAQAGQISSAVASSIRWGSLFAQGAGSGTAEAVQKTGNVGWKENVAGLGSGAIEVLTEQISPTGKFVSAKITGKTVDETAKYFAKHAIARSIVSDFAGEFIEESSSYFLNWGLQNKILKIDDSPFSWKDWAYEGVMGGIAGGLFAAPNSISSIRNAQKAGAKVYAGGEDAVKRKISEGKVELDAMRKAGMDQDPRFKEGFDIAHRALTELETNDKLTQKQKELYLGLAERAVMTSQLTNYVANLAEFNAEQAKAGLVNTQALADSLNAVVREAGGESNFKAEDFLDKDSYANRVRAIAETFSQIMTPTVEVKAAKSIVDQSAPVFTGSKAQAQEIRNLAVGDVLTYNIGNGAYATITKRGGTNKYSIAYASAQSIADGKGVFTVANDQTVAQVMEIANTGWSGSDVDVMIETAEQAAAEAEERRVQTEMLREQGVDEETLRKFGYIEGNKATAQQEQTEKPKRKPAQKKQNGKKTETKKTEAKTVKIEDLSEVEQRLVPDLGIDRSSFTREEWIEARKYVPNLDTLDGGRKARILTLVRTGNAMGINKTYLEGLVRISAVYNIGMLFTDRMPAKGFEVPTNKGAYVVINPGHLDTTYGHELFHTFAKGADGKTRADLVERVKKIVGAEAFDKAKAEYKKAYKAQFGAEISAELLDEEASASVVGNYLSNMTLLRKIASKDAGLGRRLLGAIRNMKTRWTSAKAFAKENDSTAFAEYRKMTRIEKLLMQELAKRDAKKAGDTAYSPATAESDSDGNTLSYGQQKYFARSKVRDANGRLLVVYHGTDADFDTFDLSRAGKNGRQEGFGFYFAANQEITKKYGDKQKKVYLNIEKPLYDNRRTVTKAELRKFANALVDYQVNENGEDWRDTFISNYVDTYSTNRANAISQFVETVWEANENDQDLIYEIANGSGMNYDVDTMEPFYNVLYQSIGYDGNISTWEYVPLSGKKETNTIYVTFRPEQAKYVSNFDPTISTDLRYSPATVTTSGENILYSPKSYSENLSTLATKKAEYQTVSTDLKAKREDLKNYADVEKYNNAISEAIQSKDKAKIDKAIAEYTAWSEKSGYGKATASVEDLDKKAKAIRSEISQLERDLSEQLRERTYTDAEKREAVAKAVRKFHTTQSLNRAGYLTTTGSMLDFSEGQRYRVQDHREISGVLDLPDFAEQSDGMIAFMNMGNIRLQTYGIDIATLPNAKQISALRGIIRTVMQEEGEFVVDFSLKNGDSDGSVTYPQGTSTERIITDIKTYFENGQLPNEPSEVARYHEGVSYSPAGVSYSPAGDTSSAAFKRWFGNSPFKNEDGTPKVYYHGAKKGGGFTVFRDWQYFTDKKQYAERYAERDNPNALYEVYLTADKVFDTRNEDARKVFESIRNEYGLSELQDTGLPDWTDGYDITEYLSEHPELGYDAVILDEGGDLVDGEPVSRGESIIIKDSAQVKSATDNIGTYDRANPDIRYSPVTPETDSRYLSLARDPQKNESELRRLVKEAAKAWGAYQENGVPKVLYHGTDADFTVFDPEKQESATGVGLLGKGYYFTTRRAVAKDYGNKVIRAFVKVENPYQASLDDEYRLKTAELQERGFDGVIEGDMINVFTNTQIKSADPVTYDDSGNIIPLSERFNPQNDDIRYSPASYGGKSGRYVTQSKPARQTITEKITNAKGQLNRRGLKNALDAASSAWESFMVVTVNAQQALENQLIRGGMTKQQAAAWAQYARSARLHAYNAASFKLADLTGEIRSDGLLKIIEPFLATKGEVFDAVDQKTGETVPTVAKGGEMGGKRYTDFGDYYSMLHAIDREAVGKNPYSNMTVADMKRIVAEYEKENPDFKEAAEKLSAFNSALLDIEAQAGIRSQETVDLWKKQYPHYVPMYVQEDGTIGRAPVRGAQNLEVHRDNAVATESNHRVNDALQNYLNQVERRIRAAKFNLVLQEVYNSADGVSYEQVGDKKVWSVRYLEIGKDGKEQIVEVGGFKSKKEAQIEYLKHQDNRVNKNVVRGDIAEFSARDLREQERAYLDNPETENDPVEAFRKVQKGRQTVNEVSFYMDGKRVTMAVSDRIYTGIKDLAGQRSAILDSSIAQFATKVNDIFKKLVTNWNPFFAVRNIARDLQDGLLQTKYGFFEFQKMYLKNAQMMASGKFNEEWNLFVANGCLAASILSDEFGTLAKGGDSGLEQAVGVFGQFQHIKNFNTLTEALPRFTEFCLTLKHGGTVQQAIYNAAEVTVNFGRGGTLTKILNSTVSPFLNPAVQGLDRVVRLFTENGLRNNKALASLLLKAFLLGILPMVLSNAMYGGDKEYEDMKDNVKENNYLFKIGNTWLKIPRGRVVSTISGLYNRSSKQVTGQYVDWADYGKNVLDQITPAQNVARHIASPFVDVANNKTWYGSAIESQSLQNYAVKDRYDENTSRIAVWIGQFTSHFGYSPKKVHYLLDQYSGVVGDILLPATTPAGTRGVVAYNFTVDANTSSNLSERFYKVYNEAMYAANAGDEEAYYLKRRLDETKNAASELFKEIKTINADSSLSNKEKVQQASAIRAMINQLYKTAVQDAKGYAANVKDALAINGSYEVVQITQKNAKQYGLTLSDAGKYAVTFGDQAVKLYGSEKEATEYNGDASKKTIYAEANRLTYGSEYALKEYNTNVYEKAKTLNELGISYDEYYNYYMTVRYYSGKDKKQKILAYLNGSGMSKSQTALMMYFSGYSAYKEDAKKAINASNLSAERKKELLAQYVD